MALHRPGSDRYDDIIGALARKTKEQDKRRENPLTPCQWTTWYLPESGVAVKPEPGDEILDSESNRWVVTKIEFSELSGSIRCVSRRFDATFGLDEYVDLFLRRNESTPSGTLEYRWFLVHAGIPAKLSETTSSERGTQSRQIAVRTPVDFQVDDRLRFPDGGYGRIEKVVIPQDSRLWTELTVVSQ